MIRLRSEEFSVSNITYFSRHKRRGPVKCCVFSGDGQLFASASHDCSVRIWNSRSTECVHIMSAHSRSVETVSISPDGQWLGSGGWDMRALIWSVQSSEMVQELQGHTAAVSSDSQWVATGSWDRSVRVWRIHDDKDVVTLQGHLGNVACLCFSVAGFLVRRLEGQASGSWDGTVRVWLPQQQTCVYVMGGVERVWVRSLAFSADGLLLASTAEGDMVKIWDMTKGRCVKLLKGHKDSAYGCVHPWWGASHQRF